MYLFRKCIRWIKYLGRRGKYFILVVASMTLLLAVHSSSLSQAVTNALMLPQPPHQDLEHFKLSTNLQHYLDDIEVLVEPSTSCVGAVPLLVVVASAPHHQAQRDLIRDTWGRHQPTFFILGLEGELDERMVDNHIEAKQFSDIVIFDMVDHYQNLTLKTVLMLQWARTRCPHAARVFKTDDDVVVNPWTLGTVLEEHKDAVLLGYRVNNSKLHRDEYNKWYVPRWLHRVDDVPQYLSGTGYIINGQYLESILEAAKTTPLINLEDVYLTHLVANSKLNYELTHDRRLSPYKPWVPLDCAYWTLASLHSLKPEEAAHVWDRISKISKLYAQDKSVCNFYRNYLEKDFMLY